MDKNQLAELAQNDKAWWSLDMLSDPKTIKKLNKSKDFIITLDTVSWEAVILGRQEHETPDTYNAEFAQTPETHTLEQAIAKMKEWKERGFVPELESDLDKTKFLNSDYFFVRIWQAEQGYLICNQHDKTMRLELLEKLLKFKK